jgi:class 3 adenylate cyclase/tetratricopeptide (TPR) repeat protein
MASIREWLTELSLGQYADAFEQNDIDPEVAVDLTDGDLEKLGVSMGHRKKLLKAIAASSEAETKPLKTPTWEAERRQITVMFCDLVGSTALSERLDPEDLRSLMQAYQQAAGAVIERYGGHVAQYLGDGLMTYFGWPQAHEDDAERAVRAGLDVVDAVKDVGSSSALQVRIGIATGAVVVGETGAGDASVPKLAVGETPNLAARLQGLAAADEIVVGPSTRRLLGGTFELDDLGGQALKGIVEPVHAHRVTGVAATEGRFEAQHQHLTPLVGREAEMAMVMARWEQAKAGEGQVIVLGGEPGIGKSRITQALRERIAEEPHTRLRYQCSPYHTNSALHPVIEQIERAASFQRDDTPDQKLDKLEQLIPDGVGRALIASLLSLPVERYAALGMSPQKQKEETLRTLATQVTALAAAAPVLLIFEDAHWIDPTSQELLDLIVPAVSGHGVLAVITHRPEYTPPWTGQGHVAPLALTRLGRADAAAMVARVSDTPLPDDVLDQIVAKTDGVPLFVEELTKTVLETGAETANAIPETLQDSLMARLDRLAPVREVAQIGACIGREFDHELLAAVSPLGDNELGDALQQLVNNELIFRSGNTYTFKHALVQDAAYGSLLRNRRQQLHLQLAQAIATADPQIATTAPELLGHHYTMAQDHENAVTYWVEAGQKTLQVSALQETVGHFTKALAANDELPASVERDRRELDIRVGLATAYMAMLGWAANEVLETLSTVSDLSRSLGEDDKLLTSLCLSAFGYGNRCQYKETDALIEDELEFAKTSGSSRAAIVAHTVAGWSHTHRGNFDRARDHVAEVERLYTRSEHGDLTNLINHDPLCLTLCWSGFRLWYEGWPDLARADALKQLSLAREIGAPFNLVWSLTGGGYPLVYRGEASTVLSWLEEARAIAQDQGVPFWDACMCAMAEGIIGIASKEYERGYELLKQGGDLWQLTGGTSIVPLCNIFLATALGGMGRHQEGLDLIDESIASIRETGHRMDEAEVLRVKGELLLGKGGGSNGEVQDAYEQAIEVARSQGAKSYELRAATSLARLWQSQGKTAQVHDLLAPVYGWFTEGFDTADLKEAKTLLDNLR